jgi:hypothetical protein
MLKVMKLVIACAAGLMCLALLTEFASAKLRSPSLFVAVLIFAAIAAASGYSAFKTPAILYCRHCGANASPVRHMPGSFVMELFLWLCFLIPGLIYSIWRSVGVEAVCPICGAPHMIPLNSPVALEASTARRG